MPADNVHGMRADTLALLKELDSPDLSLARRQLRQRLRLAGRHRRPRPAAAAQESGLEGHRAQRFRHRRVHALLPHAQDRAATSPSTAGWATSKQAVEELQYANGAGRHAHGQAAREERPRASPIGVKWWGDRQRNVRRLATRPHAAGRVRQEAQPVRRGDAGRRSGDQARRRRRGRPVERRDDAALRRPHGPDQRAFLLRRQARPARPTSGRSPTTSAARPRPIAAYRKRFRLAHGQGHPHRHGRMELLVRPARLRRVGHPVSPEGRPGDRRRPARVRPAERHHLHGQLRADGQRDRLHQDTTKTAAGFDDDGPGAEALPAAVRDAARPGRNRVAAGRRGGMDGGSQDAHRGRGQPDAPGTGASADDRRRSTHRPPGIAGGLPAPTRWPSTSRASRRRCRSRRRTPTCPRAG